MPIFVTLMMKKTTLILGFAVLAISSCKKAILEPNSGIYHGVFIQVLDNGDTNAQGIVNLALTSNGGGGTFSMNGDTASGAPYPCAGNYVIDNSAKMTFTNTAVVDTIEYSQPHYILDTTYSYVFDDHNFVLQLMAGTTRYQYNLIRD